MVMTMMISCGPLKCKLDRAPEKLLRQLHLHLKLFLPENAPLEGKNFKRYLYVVGEELDPAKSSACLLCLGWYLRRPVQVLQVSGPPPNNGYQEVSTISCLIGMPGGSKPNIETSPLWLLGPAQFLFKGMPRGFFEPSMDLWRL